MIGRIEINTNIVDKVLQRNHFLNDFKSTKKFWNSEYGTFPSQQNPPR